MNHGDALAALADARTWRKPTYSEGQNGCVEVTTEVSGWVGVRDSKLGAASPVLAVASDSWRAFLDGVWVGAFE